MWSAAISKSVSGILSPSHFTSIAMQQIVT
jgi:hypothetical protein